MGKEVKSDLVENVDVVNDKDKVWRSSNQLLIRMKLAYIGCEVALEGINSIQGFILAMI